MSGCVFYCRSEMNYYPSQPDSALSKLQHDELCTVLLRDGTQRGAKWSAKNYMFYFADGKGPGSVWPDDLEEWWPASVKF